MELLLPNLGLIVWTTLAFLIVFFLLSKFAWKPILQSIHKRETFIQEALDKAKEAENQIKTMQEQVDKMMKEAHLERQKLLSTAEETKHLMIEEAKAKARLEAEKLILSAKADLQKEKELLYQDVKKHLAQLIVSTTEKVLQDKLKTSKEQDKIIEKAIDAMSF